MTTNAAPCTSELCARITREYLEMPGLVLTLPQASRLWNEEPAFCERAFDLLIDSGFLCNSEGLYLRANAGRRAA